MEAVLPPGVAPGMVMALNSLVCCGSWELYVTLLRRKMKRMLKILKYTVSLLTCLVTCSQEADVVKWPLSWMAPEQDPGWHPGKCWE